MCGYSVTNRACFVDLDVINAARQLNRIISLLTAARYDKIRRGTTVVKGIVRTRNFEKPPEGNKDND